MYTYKTILWKNETNPGVVLMSINLQYHIIRARFPNPVLGRFERIVVTAPRGSVSVVHSRLTTTTTIIIARAFLFTRALRTVHPTNSAYCINSRAHWMDIETIYYYYYYYYHRLNRGIHAKPRPDRFGPPDDKCQFRFIRFDDVGRT